MGDAQRLPGKTESRRPQNGVRTLKSLSLIDQDCLIVWLIGVVTDRVKRTGQASKATAFAHGIGIMLSAESQSECKVGPQVPFILAVNAEIIEVDALGGCRGKGLAQLRKVGQR